MTKQTTIVVTGSLRVTSTRLPDISIDFVRPKYFTLQQIFNIYFLAAFVYVTHLKYKFLSKLYKIGWPVIAPDKRGYQVNMFSFFCTDTYIVGTN